MAYFWGCRGWKSLGVFTFAGRRDFEDLDCEKEWYVVTSHGDDLVGPMIVWCIYFVHKLTPNSGRRLVRTGRFQWAWSWKTKPGTRSGWWKFCLQSRDGFSIGGVGKFDRNGNQISRLVVATVMVGGWTELPIS